MNTLKTLSIFYITIFLFSCGNDDDVNSNNLPPESFTLIDVTNEAEGVDVLPNFRWSAANDPEGDTVTYTLIIDTKEIPNQVVAENLSETQFTIAERLSLLQQYSWKVIATDSQGNHTESDTFSFTTRNLRVPEAPEIEDPAFSERAFFGLTNYDDRLWVIGGAQSGGGLNDVWHSTDGINWTEAIANAPFSGRWSPTVLSFDNKLWVIGGRLLNDFFNDVWHSSDGINWTQATDNAPFGGRTGFTTAVFDNKMWVIGGRDAGFNEFDDVWYSSDGINWELATSNAEFGEKAFHASVTFNNRLWVIGGLNDSGVSNDVWHSIDGTNWSQVTTNASFSDRDSHTLVVYDDKLWIIGGLDLDETVLNDIWFSEDGVTWTAVATNESLPPKEGVEATIFNDKIWFIGSFEENIIINDIWTLD